jgi:hypothetical protein
VIEIDTRDTPNFVPGRPRRVTILMVIVFFFVCFHLLRFVLSIIEWENLSVLLPISPVYITLNGLLWSIVGLALAWGLYHRSRWAPWLARFTCVGYFLFYWVDRLFISRMSGIGSNAFFALAITILVIAWVFWVFSLSGTKQYFGE